MARGSTKQRRAAQARRWIRRHLFIQPAEGGRLLLPALCFLSRKSPPPFAPSRMFGLGWRKSETAHGFVQEGA